MSSRAVHRLGGVVTTWNDDRGFGFIKPDGGGPDVFLHFSAEPRGTTRPYEGQRLTFEIEQDDKGRPRALSAEPVLVAERAEPPVRPTSVVVAIGSILAFGTLFFVAHVRWQVPWTIAGIYLVLSILTFALYAADKRAAQTNRWRTPENTLLLVGLVGGWPGAAVAQQVLRHKTKKLSFRTRFWFSVIVNVIVFVLLAWYTSANPIPGLQLY
jgi:uncharacterized membrane protein YsdA (DUF1294 family)/cold shock CspA family protein